MIQVPLAGQQAMQEPKLVAVQPIEVPVVDHREDRRIGQPVLREPLAQL
jgi:hypothetical protein